MAREDGLPVVPLVVEFASGSTLVREHDRTSDLMILRNGPPGTFVRLGDVRISLPTDQIVTSEARAASVSLGFGGMRFVGMQDGQLTFQRVRDLRPEEELSPDRSWTMTLEPHWVAAIFEDGRQVWPAPPSSGLPRRSPEGAQAGAGLCASCVHAKVITSSRGSAFVLCQLSGADQEFPRYPVLPMRACRGHRAS
jgi:hypothetical protein